MSLDSSKLLEEMLESEFKNLGISENNQISIKRYLGMLKAKDESTYEHCLRVGLLGEKIADYMHLDPRPLFYSGLLHDVGKLAIDRKILKKTSRFDEKDMKEMRKHPNFAYRLLKDIHEFSAEVALRHHRYQENPYPKKLPCNQKCPITNADINFYARLLALVDFYDAAKTRSNNKFKKRMDDIEIKSMILEKNPDQRVFIENLYKDGILV
jgi:HD-GYP domain-containing protein (c-di-GMP phosphodiesterase class II)